MTIPEQTTTLAATGPITLDDVRSAIGDTDPQSTNASKLRKIIGRGSFETIQKHLELIRKEQAPVLLGTQAPPPPPPKDAIEAVWLAAWSASQAATYGRTERLSAERDAALELSVTRASDIGGLTADLDSLLEKVAAAESHAAELAAQGEADLAAAAKIAAEATEALEQALKAKETAESGATQAAAEAAAEAAKALEQLRSEKAKLEADAVHADELATLRATVAENAMQGTINKLNDQIVELKGLLRTTMTPAPAATVKGA